MSFGFQSPLADGRTAIGGGIAYTGDNLYSGSSSMWGSRFMLGVVAKRETTNDFVFSTDFAAGSATYQTHRYIAFPSTSVQTSSGASGFGSFSTPSVSTQGGNNVAFMTGGVRLDRTFDLDRFMFKPYFGVTESMLNVGTNRETGGGPLDFVGNARQDMYLTIDPGFELGGNFAMGHTQIRPNLDVNMNEFLGRNQAGFTAGLAGADPNLNLPFTSEVDRTLFNVSPSLDLQSVHGLGMRATANFVLGARTRGATLQFSVTQKMGPTPPH
jgi:hypothetical protein